MGFRKGGHTSLLLIAYMRSGEGGQRWDWRWPDSGSHPYLLLRSPRVIRFPDFVASFDHFVGDQQQVVVDFQIEQSGRLEVDD